MAKTTGIAWTDSTFNPWLGCTKVGPGCDNCYAETLMDKRWHRVQWGSGQPRVRTSTANWQQPLRWDALHTAFHAAHGRKRRVFCASLADVFDNAVPPQWRADLFGLISRTQHLDWLLLTKRIGNVFAMTQSALWASGHHAGMHHRLPPNVWLGISVATQKEADRDIPALLAVPARVRFLSIEPMLEEIRLDHRLIAAIDGTSQHGQRFIDWVICGGESGPHARALALPWVRSLRNQCAFANVPFFFKQWGGASASAGGCTLDGAELKAWPVASLESVGNPPLALALDQGARGR
jgi:protein gp37